MSDNLVHDAAIEVLKKHENSLKATDHTISVRINTAHRSDAPVEEIAAALRALSDKIAVVVEQNVAGGFTAKANSAISADNTLPVKQLATMIADAGVNFPGSVNYRTPGLNP